MPEYEAFSGVTCQLMRNLVKARRKAQSEREQTFEARDEATTRIGEAMIAQEPTEEHEAAYGRAVMQLDILAQRLKYLEGELDKAIETADEPNLPYKNAKVDMPDFKPRAKSHGDKPGKAKEGGDVEGQTKIQPDAPTAEGEDQHLAAAVTELDDLPESLTKTLIENGYKTIAQVVKAIDSQDGLQIKGCGENKTAQIKRSVKTFRKAHRAAMREVEQPA